MATTKAQQAIIDYLNSNTQLWYDEVSQFSKSAIRELVKQGIIERQFAFSPSNYFYEFTWLGRDTYYLDGIADDLSMKGKEAC